MADLKAKIRLEGDARGADKAIKKTEGGLKRLTSFLTSRFVITLGDVTRAVTAAFDTLKKSLSLQTQERVLKQQLANMSQSFDAFIAKVDEAANNAVSKADIIKSSSKALLLGIPATEIAELMEIARVSAAATGETIAKSFDDLATGIGRASPLILDNLGIVVKLGEAQKNLATELGKTTEELTDAERRQALLNEVLKVGRKRVEDFGDAAGGLKEKLEVAEASAANFKKAVDDLFVAFVEGAVDASEFSGSVADITKALEEGEPFASRFGTAIALMAANMAKGQNSFQAAFNAIRELKDVTEQAAAAAEAQAEAQAKAAIEAAKKAEADKAAAEVAEAAAIEQKKLTNTLKAQAGAYVEAVDAASLFGQVTSIQLEGKILDITQAIRDQGIILGEDSEEFRRYAEIGTQAIEQLRARIQNLRDGFGDLDTDTKKATSSVANYGTEAQQAVRGVDALATANDRLRESSQGVRWLSPQVAIGAGGRGSRLNRPPGSSFSNIPGGTFTWVSPVTTQPNGRIIP